MPYKVVGNCVHKLNSDGSVGEKVKCHDSAEEAQRHKRALYANVEHSEIAQMSMTVTKAVYEESESDPNRKRKILMVNSDTSPDLYDERMSLELFKDFTDRIENKTPIPEAFQVLCEQDICGDMPYLSVAHYHAGSNSKNVPGMPESVYVDGGKLKSKAYLYDNPLGRAVFDALCQDVKMKSQGKKDHEPVRVSIGFLDLEHVHEVNGKSVVFTRTALGQKCSLCEKGAGGKIYKKGHLVHLAATRKPVNPRTEMGIEEKSMDEIITKKDDAASIVGEDLAKELEEKSLTDDVLVIKASETNVPSPSPLNKCYDPNTDSFNQACVNSVFEQWMVDMKDEIGTAVRSAFAELSKPVVEETMEEKVIEKSEGEAEAKEEEVKEEPKEEKSAVVEPVVLSPLDAKFAELKSLLGTNPTAEQVQAAFNEVGLEVEKAYTPPAPKADDIAAIVKSAVEAAVQPLAVKIAQLEAGSGDSVSRKSKPTSRALTLRPADLIQKSQQPTQQLTQIQKLARRSTGIVDE